MRRPGQSWKTTHHYKNSTTTHAPVTKSNKPTSYSRRLKCQWPDNHNSNTPNPHIWETVYVCNRHVIGVWTLRGINCGSWDNWTVGVVPLYICIFFSRHRCVHPGSKTPSFAKWMDNRPSCLKYTDKLTHFSCKCPAGKRYKTWEATIGGSAISAIYETATRQSQQWQQWRRRRQWRSKKTSGREK